MVKPSNLTNSDVARMEDYGVSPEWSTHLMGPFTLTSNKRRLLAPPLLETIHLGKSEKIEVLRYLGVCLKRRSRHQLTGNVSITTIS